MNRKEAHRAIKEKMEEIGPDIRELTEDLFRNPETSLQEQRAADGITRYLAAHGFDIRRPLGGMDTAFQGQQGNGGPIIAYLVEYDALPEIGHACGHPLIAGGGVAAGVALASLGPELPGTVRVIGTPGEEKDGGKIRLLEAGVFHDVDAALMFHPGDRNIMWRHATAVVELTVTFHGVAAHAARSPQQGRNALTAMINFFGMVDGIRPEMAESSRVHGIIRHGGSAANVIPDFTQAEMLARAVTSADTLDLLGRIRACAEAAALATGCTVEFAEGPLYQERKNNHTLATRVGEYLQRQGRTLEAPVLKGGTGSSDIGNVSLVLPAIHPYLQVAPRGTAGHSIAMRDASASSEAFDAMMDMAQALALAGADLMWQSGFLDAVRDEFATSGPDIPE